MDLFDLSMIVIVLYGIARVVEIWSKIYKNYVEAGKIRSGSE